MIRLFDVENGVVIPTVHCTNIKWLKVIQDKFPENAIKIYQYIFYMSYIGEENPFYQIPEVEKEGYIPEAIGINFSLDEPEIEYAVEQAKKLYETPTSRFYIAMKSAMERVTRYMEEAAITDGRDGNLDDIMRIMKDYSKIRQSFKDVANDLKEEQEINVRGGQEIAYDQQ